ncbi:serine/threonine-protein kinase 31-like isoform X1 [Asterias rubens]|uniref:serine/threonine-protein kinase 31-like isoform X1 n=1 Tax=Asterias rubens TaxID=7604 RepID=UPI001454FB08|nr:serine/threonine-protein kinase 31-like isoform X1 [Asterias rubens]
MYKFSGKPTFDVYVTNLPDDIDEDLMRQEFSACGVVQSCTVKDGKNNAAKFGFVRYAKEESQDLAVRQLSGKYLNGKNISVKKADYNKKKNTTENPMQNGDTKRQNKGDLQSSSPRSLQESYQRAAQEYVEQEVLVTYVVDACTVYAQLANRNMVETNARLMTEINQYCPMAQRLTGLPVLSTVYGSLFSEDGMWYRCKVMPAYICEQAEQQPTKVGVHYLDYGNDEMVDWNTLVELPMSLASLPPQAHLLLFRGIKPTAENNEGNRKAVEFLQEVTENKSVRARFYSPMISSSSFTSVEIFDGTSSLNDALMQRGFATLEPNINSSAASPNKTASNQGSTLPNRAPGLMPTPTPAPQLFQIKPPQAAPSTNSRSGPGGGAVNVDKYNADVQKLKDKIKHLAIEKEMLEKELTTQKQEMQLEYRCVKETAANTVTCLLKLDEKLKRAIQDTVAELHARVAILKQTRKRVVIDPNLRDPLAFAIELLTNSTNEFVSLSDGVSDHDANDACQDFLRSQRKFEEPDAKDHLDELIKARDTSRQTAYQKMSDFLDTVNLLPLTEQKSLIKQSLDELEETYQTRSNGDTNLSLTGCGDADREHINVCINYKLWKEKKSQQLKSVRENTDARAEEWRRVIQANMINQFNLTPDDVSTLQTSATIDELARTLKVAIETEIVTTGQSGEDLCCASQELLEKNKEESKQEAAILENTVCVVMIHLRKELNAIHKLIHLQTSYTETKSEHVKWLTAKPDVSKLLATTKVIKSLRSKLRHKLAYKLDLEDESETSDDGELQKIEEELAEIRLTLQKAYVNEDGLMVELADLKHRQFGELSHQYPKFEIEYHLTKLGAVKLGRSIQHLDLKPLPGCDKKMIRLGQFDNKPVVIKSFFISDDEAREEFLVEGSLTWAFRPEGLLRLDAIYTLPATGEVHVQLPYLEMGSLEAAIAKQDCYASKPLTEDELNCIFRQVLQGLNHMHEISVIHGAVHPRNVLLTSRNSAVLAECDYSKTPTQRAQQGYMSRNGLAFTAPEISNGVEASMESDMYSFGILLLWAHYPDTKFSSLLNGTPDLSVVDIRPSVKESVTSLLKSTPATRPSSDVLRSKYYFQYATSDEGSDSASQEDHVEEEQGKEVHAEDRQEVDQGEEVELKDGPKEEAAVEEKDEPEVVAEIQEEDVAKEEPKEDEEVQLQLADEDRVEINDVERNGVQEETVEIKTVVDEAVDGEKTAVEKEPDSEERTQQVTTEASPSSGSILLKKMAIAMANSEENASPKKPDGSEI